MGKWSLLIWVNGGVSTYLWNLHQCRVDTLIALGVGGLSQMCGEIGAPTIMVSTTGYFLEVSGLS
ncbi:UNVERIFIED_CONTAM: hypothetical protein NCL1_41676 [Trichonephila clavipes]